MESSTSTESRRCEERARLAKAHAIVTFVTTHGGDLARSSTIAAFGDAEWLRVCRLAGIRRPSPETRQLVVEMLASAERIAATPIDDPFAGLS